MRRSSCSDATPSDATPSDAMGVHPPAIQVSTFLCSLFSVFGSCLVILSYKIINLNNKPRAAKLIFSLAITDFLWFSASLIESSIWLFSDISVSVGLCYVVAPLIIFARMASLIWSCLISFDVLMTVNKRKWGVHVNTMNGDSVSNWTKCLQLLYTDNYFNYCFAVIALLALPGALIDIVKQGQSSEALGCSPDYEPLGKWYEVFFTELLPILLGFVFNFWVYCTVRSKMRLKAYPQSVRKRRRRIMYHYILVTIVCWFPTILHYFIAICGVDNDAVVIIARSSLYSTGFFNFLVFGLQDPYLRQSFRFIYTLGCCYNKNQNQITSGGTSPPVSPGRKRGTATFTKTSTINIDKIVMFEEATISGKADISKDKKSVYKYNKLSKEDKELLYKNRPDLNPNFVVASSPSPQLASMATPLLSAQEFRSMEDVSVEVTVDCLRTSEEQSFAEEGEEQAWNTTDDSSSDDEDEDEEDVFVNSLNQNL